MSYRNDDTLKYIQKYAEIVRKSIYNRDVYTRGRIEFTNYCKNDCLYCGIRKSNKNANRYRLSKEQMIDCCKTDYQLGFRTLVLQGGEDPYYTDEMICDSVMLVMPQDIQAPKGRLILPQVQTIRDLLDNKCIVISITTEQLDEALATLSKPPKLIISDSQVFKTVYDKKPLKSLLTSFSVLFAAYKGDLPYYIKGAGAIVQLTNKSKVLIAKCCTHVPLTEDIGREKLPRALKNVLVKN